MTVTVLGWSGTPVQFGGIEARAYVDGVRVTVRRNTHQVRWHCAEHGDAINHPGHCAHTQALAYTPADPERNHS